MPVVTMVLTYAVYTGVMKQPLNGWSILTSKILKNSSFPASKVFSSIAAFNLIQAPLRRISWAWAEAFRGKGTFSRLPSQAD